MPSNKPSTPHRFEIVTIFPEMIEAYANASILGRGQKAGAIDINAVNLRDFTNDAHKTVDDSPYGGGPGMVMKVEPIFKAINTLRERAKLTKGDGRHLVVVTDPRGQPFTQAMAREFAQLEHLIIICGRYEGVDERVRQHVVDRAVSVGPFVLSGGELPALTITEATARLLPGVLGKEESLAEESFGASAAAHEYPQYTKPAEFEGWKVPDVLTSGDHAKIKRWRQEQARS